MADLEDVARMLADEHALVVVATVRDDGSPQASVVSCGVIDHPHRDERVLAWASRDGAVKLTNLRTCPRAAITVRRGWSWVTVEAEVELLGPDLDAADDELRLLHRAVFRAAGGTHDDWPHFDEVVRAERRVVALAVPRRVYSNPSG